MKQQAMLDQMAAVTEAQYLREHAKIKPLLDEEARLRGQLTRLNSHVADTRQQGHDDHSMQMLGADLLWQAWHTRSKRQLNIELAQITAKKLRAMDSLKKAFGRQHAVQVMADAERARTKAELRKRQDEKLMKF